MTSSAPIASSFCGPDNCVEITEQDGTFVATSTISPDRGAVTYDPAEVATFLRDVKNGAHDDLLARAEQLAGKALTTV